MFLQVETFPPTTPRAVTIPVTHKSIHENTTTPLSMTPRLNETAPFNRVSSCHSQATVITLAFFLAVFITFTGFWVGHWFWKRKRNNVSVDDSVGLIPFQRMEDEV